MSNGRFNVSIHVLFPGFIKKCLYADTPEYPKVVSVYGLLYVKN